MPAEPNTPWEASFPRSGADLFLIPGDQVVLLEIPNHFLTSRGRLRMEKAEFYVAEVKGYDDTGNEPKLTLHLKGCEHDEGKESDPYNQRYQLGWKLTASAARKATRNQRHFIFSTGKPLRDYAPVEMIVESRLLLPVHAFELTKGHTIPKRVQKNIRALMEHRAPKGTKTSATTAEN